MSALLLEFWPHIASALAVLAGVLGIYRKGRGDANMKHKAKKAKANDRTHERINDVEPVDPDNRDDIVSRLRQHGGQ